MGATGLQDEILGKVVQQEVTRSPHGRPTYHAKKIRDEGHTGDMLRQHALGEEDRRAKRGSR